MATWEPNEEMYGPGGGDIVDELGNRTPDPFGAMAPAPAPAAAPVAAPTPGFQPVAPVDPGARPNIVPAGPNVVAGDSYRPAGTLPGVGSFANEVPPDLQPGAADAAAGGPAGPPDLKPGAADAPSMIPVTQSTSQSSTSTSGVDAGSRKAIEGATTDANAAAQKVGTAEAGNLEAQAAQQQAQAQSDYARGVNNYFTKWGELQTQEQIASETDRRLQEAAKFKPDRTALFRGDTGLMFGLSAAVAAMAGGWLMGQGLTGGKNPYLDTIMQMIDDDANDQIATNSQTMEQLTRIYGDTKAASKDLKARMLQEVNNTIEAQTKFNEGDQIRRGAPVAMARVEAEQAKNRMESAKLTAQTVTKQHQTTTQQSMVANPALTQGFDLNDPKIVERVGKVGALENLASEASSLAANGGLKENVGLLDEAAGAVAGWFNAKGVPAQRVEALRAKWELIQRANWASEPNGEAVQQRLSSIGFPQNDAGIPLFLQNVREALNTVDPGGRYRMVARGMGQRPATAEKSNRTPIVR